MKYEFSRDDDFGWLIAHVQTPDFSGRNGMWVQWQDLVGFAECLASYPIDPGNTIVEDWGFTLDDAHTTVTRIEIAPSGNTGGLVCDVTLANYYEPQNACRCGFSTDYPTLARFREELAAMMRKEGEEALLAGASD